MYPTYKRGKKIPSPFLSRSLTYPYSWKILFLFHKHYRFPKPVSLLKALYTLTKSLWLFTWCSLFPLNSTFNHFIQSKMVELHNYTRFGGTVEFSCFVVCYTWWQLRGLEQYLRRKEDVKHTQPAACSLPCSHSDTGLWESALVRRAPYVALRGGGDAWAAAHHHQNCCRDGSRDGHFHIISLPWLQEGSETFFQPPKILTEPWMHQVERMLTNICPSICPFPLFEVEGKG